MPDSSVVIEYIIPLYELNKHYDTSNYHNIIFCSTNDTAMSEFSDNFRPNTFK